jgi:hypothetical protein
LERVVCLLAVGLFFGLGKEKEQLNVATCTSREQTLPVYKMQTFHPPIAQRLSCARIFPMTIKPPHKKLLARLSRAIYISARSVLPYSKKRFIER